MITVDELSRALPVGVVVTDAESIEKYREDFARDGSAGKPLAVVRAETAEHVQIAVRWAALHRVPVVPRGAGTGLSGGSSAVDGGITISLERMRGIEIDPDTRVAIVEPLVSARSFVVGDLLDRRQHRHQRRRPVLREVRRHHRLCPRA